MNNDILDLKIGTYRLDEILWKDELLRKGKLRIVDDISQENSQDFIEYLTWCIECGDQKELEIILCSPGGSVFHTLFIYDMIRKFIKEKGMKIITLGTGQVASGGSILFQAGSERIITKHTWTMIHEIQTTKWGDTESTSKSEDELALLKRIQKQLVEIYCERSNLKPKEVERKWKYKEWWLDSEQMLELGLADKVVDTAIPQSKDADK